MKKRYWVILLVIVFVQAACLAARIAPAFPGAEGYGANAIGGRGGEVYYVTNLNDSGPGSLRDAISQPHRTVMFKVSGTIELESMLDDWAPYITIAGQTAPGDGICVKNYAIRIINTHDIIIRHLRVRCGDEQGLGPSEMDSFDIMNAYDIMIDHCSFSWALDENATLWARCNNISVQWCIISEGLMPHSAGSLLAVHYEDGHTSFHHNLYAHNNYRNPRVDAREGARHYLDWRNNVTYNWGYRSSHEAGNATVNYVNNYLVAGPDTEAAVYNQAWDSWHYSTYLYFEGNWVNGSLVNWSTPGVITGYCTQMFTPFEAAFVATDGADVAYTRVLDNAGATLPQRDSVDTRVINEVINGTGGFIRVEDCSYFEAYCAVKDCDGLGYMDYCHSLSTVAEIGGWPTLNSTTPPQDTDNDGMPDSWENTYGLDINDAEDRNLDPDFDGYTNLEEYLNDTSPSEDDSEIVYIEDDFEDGDYVNEPNWTFSAGSGQILLNSPGSTDGNYWLEVGTGPTVAACQTDFSPVTTDRVEVSARVLWRSDADNSSNWAGFYIYNSDGAGGVNTDQYILFAINYGGDINHNTFCYVRGAGGSYISPVPSPINQTDTWYDVRCVFDNTTKNLQIWIDGVKYLDYNHPTYNGYLTDPARLWVYSRHSHVHGFDDILLRTAQKCGDWGTVFLVSDLNSDCHNDFQDVTILVEDWLECSNPESIDCADFYDEPYSDTGVVDDFEDGDFTSNPVWTPSGSCNILKESGDNYFLQLTGNGSHITTPSGIGIGDDDYTDVTVTGRLKFSIACNARVYLISYNPDTHIIFILATDGLNKCGVYVRKNGGTTFSHQVSDIGLAQTNKWYSFKLVWTREACFEIWIDSGSGLELVWSECDPIALSPEIGSFDALLLLYTTGATVKFDNINVTGNHTRYCGDMDTEYLLGDLNKDCLVNLKDFAGLAYKWLECSDPEQVNCGLYFW